MKNEIKGQLSLFPPEYIKDMDCTKDTPLMYGNPDIPIYGTGKRIGPRVAGRTDTDHMKKIYLEELLPLEEYDLIVVLFSGGKDSVTANLEKTRSDKKILIVSGERRGESAGRAKYNEMEIHRTNAEKKAHRTVHQWRPVIDYSEKDVWEVLKRHKVNPHPCYRAGWNRCSCAMCIFSTPPLFAGIRELYPEDFEALRQDEKILGFTLDNKCDLDTFVGDAESCVYHGDEDAIRSLITGEFSVDDVYVKGAWMYPAGAFHGAEGGPC